MKALFSRKYGRSLSILFAVVLFSLISVAGLPSPSWGKQDESDGVIVRFRDGLKFGATDASEVARKLMAVVEKKTPNRSGLVLMKKSKSMSMSKFLESLRGNPEVLSAEENVTVSIPDPTPEQTLSAVEANTLLGSPSVAGLPSDPQLTWGYADIMADAMPPCPSSAPMVAVLDTGVDYTHPELAGRVVLGQDFHNGDNNPMDDHGHGTHVSGIIAATGNNGQGSSGISDKSPILAIKVLGADGSGSMWNVIQGLMAAADYPEVKVINMSLGSFVGSASLHDAIDYAVGKGKLVVAAAGNSNTNTPYFPAFWSQYSPGVIAVAANDQSGCKASFSNYGFWVTVSAPGVSILSTLPNNSYASWSGTSMAAPFVAGAAAHLLAYNPNLSQSELVSILKNNGDPNRFDNSCWLKDSAPYPFEGRTSSFLHLNLWASYQALGSIYGDLVPPTVMIVSPDSKSQYYTENGFLSVLGEALDDKGVVSVSWINSRGGQGSASGTQTWEVDELPLYEGENIITITATDQSGNVGSASIKATYLPQTEGIVTLNLGVSTGNGDAYEVVSTGVSKADARRVYLGKNYMLGYHFEGVSIPKGAVVVSTKLLQYCVSYNDKAISLGYVGEASGNPAPYGSVKHALSSRPKTLAMVTEQPATWSKESFNESADLRDILQEVVNRPDWVAGNAVNLYVLDRNSKSTRYLSHFEDSAGKGAQLKIQWRMP